MKFTVLPKTRLGKCSVGLSILFIILILLKMQDSMPLPTFAVAVFGIAGFILALIAIFRNKDKVILIFLPLLVGLVIIFWIAAELTFPH